MLRSDYIVVKGVVSVSANAGDNNIRDEKKAFRI